MEPGQNLYRLHQHRREILSRRHGASFTATILLVCTILVACISLPGCTGSKKQAREHYTRAVGYEKEGKIQKAIEEYYTALRLNPSSIQTHRDYQRLMLSKGQIQALLDYYEQESRNNARNPAFFYLYGRLLETSQERIDQYTRSLALDPNFVWSLDAIGMEYMKQGKTDEAIRQFMKVIEIDSEFAPVHINLCRAFLEKKKTEAAYSEIKKYLQLEPDSSDGYTELGNVHREKGEMSEALEAWQKALELNGKNTRALMAGALVLAEKEDYQKAEEMLEKARAISPDNPRLHYTFALIYRGQGKVEEASGEIGKAMEKDPANPLYLELGGDIAKLTGDYDKARENYEKLLLKNAHNAKVLASLADVYQKQGDLERALSAAAGALSSDRKLTNARRTLAYLLLCRGNSKGSAIEYLAIIAAREDIPEDHFNLGCAFMVSKQSSRAIVEIKNALKREPRKTDYLLWLYFWGDCRAVPQESSALLAEISKASPDRLIASQALALSLCMKHQYDRAIETLGTALKEKEVDPMTCLVAGMASMGKKENEKAIVMLEKASTGPLAGKDSLVTLFSLACQGEGYGRMGEEKKGLEILSGAGSQWPPLPVRGWIEYLKAVIYAGNGDADSALPALEKTVRLGYRKSEVLKKDPLFSPLLKKADTGRTRMKNPGNGK